MLNKYPLWKYVLILAVLVIGFIYSAPNLYPDDPAIQISGASTALQVGQADLERASKALVDSGIAVKASSLAENGKGGLLRLTKQEVHATGQVETQLHRRSANAAQPFRRGLSQVERDNVIVAQRLACDIFGWQLVFLFGQTQQTALAVLGQRRALDRDASIGKRLAYAIQISLIDLQRSACAGDLNSRVIRVEIGCGINKTDHQHCQDQDVFPQRVFVQHHAACL